MLDLYPAEHVHPKKTIMDVRVKNIYSAQLIDYTVVARLTSQGRNGGKTEGVTIAVLFLKVMCYLRELLPCFWLRVVSGQVNVSG